MSKINLLSEEIINKIAAGEVIERPAAVVKELIENSLDAKARKIFVTIEGFGQKLISVADDGLGMEEEDAKLAILRHATSKINSAEDLFSINTLGFRGEALASIAAVSNLTIFTLPRGRLDGFQLVVEGGNVIKSGPGAANYGTVMEVRNLFFNTPARKKFLKSEVVELKHIVDIVERYALINQKVHFRLANEGKVLIDSPSANSWKDKISTIYGTALAKDLLEINYEEEAIKITGFIAKPYQARNDKNFQSLYVNGRWIKNEELSKAIYDAYHSLLFVHKHPVLVLNLDIDSTKVDVNVHPTKELVKFEQKALVNRALFTAIKDTLLKNNLIPKMNLNVEQQLGLNSAVSLNSTTSSLSNFNESILNNHSLNDLSLNHSSLNNPVNQLNVPEKSSLNVNNLSSNNSLTDGYAPSKTNSNFTIKENESEFKIESESEKQLLDIAHGSLISSNGFSKSSIFSTNSSTTSSSTPISSMPELDSSVSPSISSFSYKSSSPEKIPEMRLIGQVRKTFFLAEIEDGILLIDQHVVQERILYEKFMEQYLNKKIAVQSLLQGEMLEFSAVEKVSFKDNKENLEKLGFIIEEFGERTFLLKSVPAVLGRTQPKELFLEALGALSQGYNRLEEIQEEIITRMACRASVKAGDYLSLVEMKKLLEELAKAKLPYTCPHGRSVLIKVSFDELEKKFKRKG
ncbi:DNA mismatch repair endonuclease MutL [Candidatus Woesearchaeota archaeon]|nr:DNA mismatch repair endonuclease MutL [Candidatus Woesearchaeota archaeon]